MESKTNNKSSCSCISLECVLKVLTFLELLRELFMSTKEFYPGVTALWNMNAIDYSIDEIQNFFLTSFLWFGKLLIVLALLDSINPIKGRVREFGIYLGAFAYFTLIPISNLVIRAIYVSNWKQEIWSHWESIFLVLPQLPILIFGMIHYFRCKSELSRWDNEAAMRNRENLPLIRVRR